MRNVFALTLGVLCLPRWSIAQATSEPSFRALEGYLQAELTHLRVPGAAVAIVRGDSLVHNAMFGRADESGRAVTLETPFLIGSLSKSMTALAIMELVDAGTIGLDSPVTQYLRWFHPAGQDGWGRVTIRNLLNQNSGIPASAGRMDWAHPDTSDTALERHTGALAGVRLAHPPGTAFEYANANYALLGQVIQAVTGMSYETYVRDRLFRPLAMNRSFTSQLAAERSGMARGYRFWFGHPVAAPGMPFVRSDIPAGYLISSAADMARYLSVHLQEGRRPSGRLVSSAAMEELHRPVSKVTHRWSYAMGWMSGTLAGQTVLWHNGLVPGFYTFMALVPQRHEGMVILTNAGDILDLPRLNRVALGALTRLLGGDPGLDPPVCGMCPVYPQIPSGAVVALRPIAIVLLLLQCSWIVSSGMKRRWRSRSANIVSLSLSVIWVAVVLFLVPSVAQTPLSMLNDLTPDLAGVAYSSMAIALGWSLIRVGITAKVTPPKEPTT